MPGDEFNHLPKFADFAQGDNSQLDAVSIQKYVARMVEVSQWTCVYYNCIFIWYLFHPQAVFQVYDTDNSGSISVDEFEMISSNFPFIQAFSELDMDKWGRTQPLLLCVYCECGKICWVKLTQFNPNKFSQGYLCSTLARSDYYFGLFHSELSASEKLHSWPPISSHLHG